VRIAELTATQPGVLFEYLRDDYLRPGSDEYPHVIIHEGVQYLEDGHHRVMRKALKGKLFVWARVREL
jgi:hypothetical protein